MRRRLPFTLALLALAWAPAALAAVTAPVSGEIQSITLNNPADHWSGGTIVVGGTIVTIPRNLLLDLPANRLTLQELYAQAPAACVAVGETGLAKMDTCNTSGMGGIATISANYTANGNVIAGDVLIEKGVESIIGQVTYINYAEGYFRLNGLLNDPATGVMVRLNDPDGRHTVQVGAGCAGGPNCSADPRFLLDADNYTNTFSSGYPWCIPSTVARTSTVGLPALPGFPAVPAGTTASAAADGSGDVLCPQTNRPGTGPAADSRRFAPIKIGDQINAEGNFETVNGVRFLSAHSSMVLTQLTTSLAAGQPDYLFIEEAFIDGPGFQNERVRSLFIGFTTLAPADVLLWSIHYDPVTNSPHEFPLGTTRGCDTAAGPQTCTGQGLAATGADIFRIRHDVDFLVGAKPRLNPCAHLAADPRMGIGICPAGGAAADANPLHLAEQFAILSPIPHEIQFRTGRKFAPPNGTPLVTIDVHGNEATNGQYLFPFGMNLGGIDVPNAFEFNLNAVNTPFSFSGIPWNLDRRLSPGGCFGPCEATPQPLDPFPFEGPTMDPRALAAVPVSNYVDPNFTASPLTDSRNRILSFVSGAGTNAGRFDGNLTVLAWPPADAPLQSIAPTPDINLVCSAASLTNSPPVAVADFATTLAGVPVVVDVLANDSDPDGNPLTVSAVGSAAHGTAVSNGSSVTYTPTAGFSGSDAFTVTISDGQGGTATGAVSVTVDPVIPPPPLPSGVLLVATPASPQAPGTPITFVASVTAGSGTYEYQFSTKTSGQNYAVQRAYGTVSSWTWTPTEADTGPWDIQVDVRNVGSAAASEAVGNVFFYQIELPATAVTLEASPPTSQVVGNPVSFTARATNALGQTGPFEYRFWLNDGNAYLVVQDWSPEVQLTTGGVGGVWTWTPGKTGIHDIFVEVRGFGSTGARDPLGFTTLLAYEVLAAPQP